MGVGEYVDPAPLVRTQQVRQTTDEQRGDTDRAAGST